LGKLEVLRRAELEVSKFQVLIVGEVNAARFFSVAKFCMLPTFGLKILAVRLGFA
jgi:hypothetical protein